MEMILFSSSPSNISAQPKLRCGVLYRSFWDVDKGFVLRPDLGRFDSRRIGSFIKPCPIETLKKGELDNEYILIELEDIEPLFGRIIKEKIVTEIRSDKVVFGDSDILISKLRPYLGKLVVNDKSKPYIGTTELVPLKITDKNVKIEFLKYLFLSERFVQKNTLLMYGKEHPRISIEDFLRMKVPLPPLEKQEEIVKKLAPLQEELDTLSEKIQSLQIRIESIFIKYGVKNISYETPKEWVTFACSIHEISEQLFSRCGALYSSFWHIHNGFLFEPDAKYPIVRLKEVLQPIKPIIFRKGSLDQEYILVDLEDLEPKGGRILNVERIVTEINSDKILFGNADIIISKIDPYLGYVFLNDKDKLIIGSTELVPFKIAGERVLPDYIKYLLLSFEFLHKASLLMYGKRHPRIHVLDLLSIKIPLPDLDTQKNIVTTLKKEEGQIVKQKKKVDQLRSTLQSAFWSFLQKK